MPARRQRDDREESPRRRGVVPRVLFSDSRRSDECKEILDSMQRFVSSQFSYIRKLFEQDTDETDLLSEKIHDFIMHAYNKLIEHSSLDERMNDEIAIACANAYSKFSDEYFRDFVQPARIVIDDDRYTLFCNNFWICQCIFALILIYNQQRNAFPPATFANYEDWFDRIANVRQLKSALTHFFVGLDDIAMILTCSPNCRTKEEMTFLFYNIRQGVLSMCGPVLHDQSALECLGQIQGWQCFAMYFNDVDSNFNMAQPYTDAEHERLLDQYETFQARQLADYRNQFYDEEEMEEAMRRQEEAEERWPEDPDEIPMIESNGRLKFNATYVNPNTPLPVVSEPVDFEKIVQDLSTLDEVSVKDWLNDDPSNIILKLSIGVLYPISKDRIRSEMNKGRNIQYKCPHKDSFRDVEQGEPYFSLRSIGFLTGGLVKFSSMQALLDSPERVFSITPSTDPAEIMYATSHNSLYLARIPFYASRGDLNVSAAHCQEGSNQLLYNIHAIQVSVPQGGGKKRKTAGKRPKKRKSTMKKKLRR